MRTQTKFSYLVLKHFFFLHPDQLRTFIKSPSDVVLWEAIFQHFFQTPPFDTEVVTYPLERRAGSADPRWDYLFVELDALTAQSLIIRQNTTVHHAQAVTQLPLKEAA